METETTESFMWVIPFYIRKLDVLNGEVVVVVGIFILKTNKQIFFLAYLYMYTIHNRNETKQV